MGSTSTRESFTISLIRCVTHFTLSPGIRRKFTTAVAVDGTTLSLIPPDTIVTAVVVRTTALPAGIRDIPARTTGSKSHRFAMTNRREYGISGPTVLNMARVASLMRDGRG